METQPAILERFRVDGQVAVVTGAGRGIGAGAAIALAEAGADVLLAARTEAQLEEVAATVRQLGRRAHAVVADLADPAAAPGLAKAAKDEFGRLDIVINNVGGAQPDAFLSTSVEAMEQAFRFNVGNAHALNSAAVPVMLENGGGSIVNIVSLTGRVGGRGYLAYGTGKAALAHYTRLAAADLSPRIRVNAIAPGSIATSALEGFLQNDAARTAMENTTPLHRIGTVADISAAILYLASPAGSFLTGKMIEVDGGLQRTSLDMPFPDL